MVSDGPSAGGVWDVGLTAHTGGLTATWFEVTAQLRETGLSKPPVAWRSMIAVADPPGSTEVGVNPFGTLRLKSCPKAREAEAAENSDSHKTKTRKRTTCLGFTMSGWELTTFDSSNGAKAARVGPKECRLVISRKSNVIRQASRRMRQTES
jgi:hypothetical protein